MSRLMLVFLLVWGIVVPARAADFLERPRELCTYFASLGMKAQFQWGKAPQGEAYLCQYADEFGGNTRYVRGARVYVDPESGDVGAGLSIQGFGLVRAEAADVLDGFVEGFFQARGVAVPEELGGIVRATEAQTLTLDAVTVTSVGQDLWDRQRVVGLSWSRKASEAQLSALGGSLTPEETSARALVQSRLESRCRESVKESGFAEDLDALERSTRLLSASRYQVELRGDEGSFSCQICDDTDPGVNCGSMGLRLSFTDANGARLELPAELDRKCIGSLQKEISTARDGSFIDHDLVRRISVREVPNDKRYVFELEVDGKDYRCVIRKNDMSYRVEQALGDDEWRSVAAGIML